MTTVYDVARVAGVSTATVSRVMRGSDLVPLTFGTVGQRFEQRVRALSGKLDGLLVVDPPVGSFAVANTGGWAAAGTGITMVVSPVLVYELTGSPAWVAAVNAIEAAPYIALGLLAGVRVRPA